MPPIVVERCARIAIRGRVHDRPWVNVFDTRITVTAGSRVTAMEEKCIDLLDVYSDEIAPASGPEWKVEDAYYLDLDSVSGAVGLVTDTPTNVFPTVGSAASPATAGNVAVILRKVLLAARGSRGGRTYLSGCTEAAMSGQLLQPANLTVYQNIATALFAAWDVDVSGPATAGCEPVVISGVSAGNPVYKLVLGMSARSRLATQRRRLNG